MLGGSNALLLLLLLLLVPAELLIVSVPTVLLLQGQARVAEDKLRSLAASGFSLPGQPACGLHPVEQIAHMAARAVQQISQFAERNLLRLALTTLPQADELLLQT